ncbi:YitT family protein [Anaerosinus massiliensis]|uniref:YitT family protein n=1 Tax=Massilibacillus massiliensis TaxID=1806837 RepID=UPI000A6A5E4D|nr:YitT family protein [Massilibacillus massiliensis]
MKGKIVRYGVILIGCLISSASINIFLVPHQLLSGGVSGIAIIFYYLFAFPIGVQMLIMNLPLLFAAYKTLGKIYTIDVVFGTVLFSLCIDLMKFLSNYNVVDDPMLAAIYGGVFTGIGYGIIFRANGSSGGLDIVAAIVKKYYSLNMGFVIFAFNCLIMLIAASLFGVKLAMLTLISMYVSSSLTDKVAAGFNNKKTVIIISNQTAAIAEGIISEIGRGVTFLKAEGAFTHQHKDVIFVVASLMQFGKIKLIANAIDPMAFMIIQDANEVMGRGFTLPGTALEEKLKLKNLQKQPTDS